MIRYHRNKTPRKGPVEVLAMPEEPEEAAMKWETEMINVFHFTATELDAFKRIRSRVEFLDYCELNGIFVSI